MKATFFKSAIELRNWLKANHDQASEVFVGFYKRDSKVTGITYSEALDQAICLDGLTGFVKASMK